MPVNADIHTDPEVGESGLRAPEQGVYAHAVDTMVEPTPASKSGLGQLAFALKDLNPELEHIATTVQQRQEVTGRQQGAVKGEELYNNMVKDRKSYADLVNSGQIQAIENPYARIAARETAGRLAAEKYQSDFQSDPNIQQALDGATDMGVFDQAEQSFRKTWEETNLGHPTHNDAAFSGSFSALRSAHVAEIRGRFATEVARNFIGINLNNISADQAATLRNSLEAPGDNLENLQGAVKVIQQQSEWQMAHGMSARMVGKANAKALATLAEDVGAGRVGLGGTVTPDDIFDIAKQLNDSNPDQSGSHQATLWDDPDMAKLRQETLDKVRTEGMAKERMDRITEQNHKEQVVHDTIEQMVNDGQAGKLQGLSTYADKIAPYDPTLAKSLPTLMNNLVDGHWNTDPVKLTHIRADLVIAKPGSPDYVSLDTLRRAFNSQEIDRQDFLSLASQVLKRDNPKTRAGGKTTEEKTADALSPEHFGNWIATEMQTQGTGQGNKKGADILYLRKAGIARSEAIVELQDWLSGEKAAGKNPGAPEITKQQDAITNRIMQRLLPSDGYKEWQEGNQDRTQVFSAKPDWTQRVLPYDDMEDYARDIGKPATPRQVAIVKNIMKTYNIRDTMEAHTIIQQQMKTYGIVPSSEKAE